MKFIKKIVKTRTDTKPKRQIPYFTLFISCYCMSLGMALVLVENWFPASPV